MNERESAYEIGLADGDTVFQTSSSATIYRVPSWADEQDLEDARQKMRDAGWRVEPRHQDRVPHPSRQEIQAAISSIQQEWQSP